MMTSDTSRYAPSGLCAIEPSAFGLEFPVRGHSEPFRLEADSGVAVVEVCGPLTYDGYIFESYRSVASRVRAALESSAHTVVLHIASPGGDVFGAFDTSRELRRAASAAGKRLVAFTDAQCCSSAYALASAADEIVVASSAVVGSIGVIYTLVDSTQADAEMGLRFSVVMSGARKADGNPHVPLSEDALKAAQQAVDAMAAEFFALVREHRNFDPAPLEAATFIGREAVTRRLADRVETWNQLMTRLANGIIQKDEPMSMSAKSENDDVREVLTRAAEEGDERAKRALAAYDAEDDEPDPDAEAEDDEKDKSDPDASVGNGSASAVAAAAAPVAAGAEVAAIARIEAALRDEREARRKLEARLEQERIKAFLATRPDLSPELVKSLEGMPFDRVQAIVNAVPKAQTFAPRAPELARPPTRGGESTPGALTPNPELDARMGIVSYEPSTAYDPETHTFQLGVLRPASGGKQ